MDVAEWIIVAILSMTLMVFLIVGIVLFVKLIGLSKEVGKIVEEGQDIAKNTNDVVSDVKGITSVGGKTVELFVDKYINPKLKKAKNKRKESTDGDR